jgi:hypothetical protein
VRNPLRLECVSRPPRRPRRVRLRRPLALLLTGVALPALGVSFLLWWNARFPARSERLTGTPVELRVQDGVSGEELRAIRDGLRHAHRFFRAELGRTVRGPVEARVAREDRCRRSTSADASLIGEGRYGFLCVNTANVHWQSLAHGDPTAASIAAHEYVHVLQAEAGCLPKEDEGIPHWLVEGMATQLAWRALVWSGRTSDAGVRRVIQRDGALDPHLEGLEAYEHGGGRIAQYALWHLAVRSLLRHAVATRATPAERPELALRRLCERVGAGGRWRDAFTRSFGLPVSEFYGRFEAARGRGSSTPDLTLR